MQVSSDFEAHQDRIYTTKLLLKRKIKLSGSPIDDGQPGTCTKDLYLPVQDIKCQSLFSSSYYFHLLGVGKGTLILVLSDPNLVSVIILTVVIIGKEHALKEGLKITNHRRERMKGGTSHQSDLHCTEMA